MRYRGLRFDLRGLPWPPCLRVAREDIWFFNQRVERDLDNFEYGTLRFGRLLGNKRRTNKDKHEQQPVNDG